VNRDKTGEADEMNLEVDLRRCDAYPNERSVIFQEMIGGQERVRTDEENIVL